MEIPETAIEVYKAFAWYEMLKRIPSAQAAFPIAVALNEARLAFREISAHVATPGDRTREIHYYV